jgi:lipoyl-dependent peroxiredoxin
VPRIARAASVAWRGSLSRGAGVASADSGAFELPIDLPARVGDPGGKTSPEELLAAAHAGCYAMSLAGEIARVGGTVESLDVRCTVIVDEVEGKGHLVVASELEVDAGAEIDEASFQRAVGAADEGCTFSALIRATASVSVRAHLHTSQGSEHGG